MIRAGLLALALATLLPAISADAAKRSPRLPAPVAQAPEDGLTAHSIPPVAWKPVPGAASYEVQISADPGFGAVVTGSAMKTANTTATLTKTVPDGEYHWRVRPVDEKQRIGNWSTARRIVKTWADRPDLLGPVGGLPVPYPADPLVLKWSTVPGAFKYVVTIATDPSLAHGVLGSTGAPVETSATAFAVPGALAPGQYYWAVTPVDPRGHRGTRSAVGTFLWTWPSETTGQVTDLADDPRVYDPQLSWSPVAGASGYEVEVNFSQDWAISSKVCCDGKSIGTTVSPTKLLRNNTYYWRVRALDVKSNPGVWNEGPSFRKAFDDVVPSVPNLHIRDNLADAPADLGTVNGAPVVRHPIITWDPVPGASGYELQLTQYKTPAGDTPYCDWTDREYFRTPNPGWSMLDVPLADPPGPAAWKSKLQAVGDFISNNLTVCARVMAIADFARSPQLHEVTSEWTQIGGDVNSPAFTYQDPLQMPEEDALHDPRMDADDYLPPLGDADGDPTLERAPVLRWKPVPDAKSYWVVVARDAAFTNVDEVAFTTQPSHAMRTTLEDETTRYYWVVIPSPLVTGGNVPTSVAQNNPQSFDKQSIAPVPAGPADGGEVAGQPTFRWSSAEGAETYRLQVARDPAFGSILDDVTTAATSFTPTKTYPVELVLHWRVRAVDGDEVGLSWSKPQTFRRRLPAPALNAGNPAGGGTIPVLSWTPVQGAVAYGLHVEEADGKQKDFTTPSTSFTPTTWYGTGVWRWQVRAVFPGEGATSAYSPEAAFTRSIGAVVHPNAIRERERVILSWQPSPMVKGYQVDISTNSSFTSIADTIKTDYPYWAPDLTKTAYLSGGRLRWRVAAIDEGGNLGAWASGALTLDRKLLLTATGTLRRRSRTLIMARVTDGGRVGMKRARVRFSGGGLKLARKTDKSGYVRFWAKPRRRGTVRISATLKGYKSARTTLKVR